MTEAEWRTCADPQVMLSVPRLRGSDRQFRLLAAAFARRASRYFPAFDSESFFAELERHCDGPNPDEGVLTLEARAEELQPDSYDSVMSPAWEAIRAAVWYRPHYAAQRVAKEVVWARIEELAGTTPDVYATGVPVDECTIQCHLLRCIFGNPFRPVAPDPRWLTSTVVDLARGIYDERAFDRMPILADALQDAGCDTDDVLNHCRASGPHARGCWVVDLVLGKS